jgi:hypothetical protein
MPHLAWLITCSHYPLASVLWWDKFELLPAGVRSSPPTAAKWPVHVIFDEVQPLLVWNSVWTCKSAHDTVASKRTCERRWLALIGWSCLLIRWWHLISLSLYTVKVSMYLMDGDAEIALSDVNTAGGSNRGYGWRCCYITENFKFLYGIIYLSHSESFKCVCEGREKKYNCG